MVLRLIRDLPGVPGFSHRRLADHRPQSLIPASEDQDHTISPSAFTSLVSRCQCVHRIPRPTLVTIAKRPSCGRGWAHHTPPSISDKEKYFSRQDLTRFSENQWSAPQDR